MPWIQAGPLPGPDPQAGINHPRGPNNVGPLPACRGDGGLVVFCGFRHELPDMVLHDSFRATFRDAGCCWP